MGEGMQKKRNFFGCNFSLRKNRRGLSAIVTTLLIILLSIVAIGAVWVVISNVIDEGSEDINLARFTLDIVIKSAYVDTADSNKIKVSVRRSVGKGDVKGLNFVFSDGSKSVVVRKDIVLNELDERTFEFTSAELEGIGFGSGDTVSIAPIFDSSGSEKTGEITDTEKISSSASGGGGGGGGDLECSDGIDNDGDGNTDLVDAGCVNAEDDDETNCGDGACEGGENSDNCLLDCPLAPSSCNGAWDSVEDPTDENECDGSPTPNGCVGATCMCEFGYTSDGVGGCSLNPAIILDGTVFSVWPDTSAVVFFDSSQLPIIPGEFSAYGGRYIKFSGGACTTIGYLQYVFEI